jgi:DNA-binding GntR family transcriptional regulator
MAPRQENAYQKIRRQILDGQLRPDEPLGEYQLAADLKMSRTPIREALKRLEHDGLVRFVVNRGAFVQGLSVSDVVEIYQVREQLEGFAAFVAATEMPEWEINSLRAELTAAEKLAALGRGPETFESDIHLHQRIIACTHNRRLIAILTTLDDQVHRIRVFSPNTPGRLEATLREHEEILANIEARNAEGARAAMLDHLRSAQDNAVQLLRMLGATRPFT